MGKKAEHHGGAWKVAYADFVTAMMALFIVLWIIAPEPNDVKVVYEDEVAAEEAPPPEPIQGGQPGEKTTPGSKDADGKGMRTSSDKRKNLEQIGDELLKMLNIPDIETEKPVEVKVMNQSLKVTLFDRAKKPFFEKNSTKLTEWGEFVLKSVAYVANRHGMSLLLDGHTTTVTKTAVFAEYGPWELSADRAAASRRRLLNYEMKPDQIIKISGYADTRPLEGVAVTAPENQRLTIHMGVK